MPISHLLDTSVYCQPLRKKPLSSVVDLLIAATARSSGLVLATLNARHLEGIEGLAVEDWSSTPAR